MKSKKSILLLCEIDENLEKLRESLTSEMKKHDAIVTFVLAKDGIDAAVKAKNQKFDAMIVDTDMPRFFEGDFVKDIHAGKNTSQSEIFVVTTASKGDLRPGLEEAQFISKPYSVSELIPSLIKAMIKTEGPHSRKFSVDVRVLNAIIKATLHVCQQFGLKDVTMQKPELRDIHSALLGDVASFLPIKSQVFNGAMVLSFDKSSYLQMVSTMLGEVQTEINNENSDAIGEINNIIFGNAKPDFTQFGVELVTPKILEISHVVETPEGSARMLVPFFLEKGKFFIEVIAYPAI